MTWMMEEGGWAIKDMDDGGEEGERVEEREMRHEKNERMKKSMTPQREGERERGEWRRER